MVRTLHHNPATRFFSLQKRPDGLTPDLRWGFALVGDREKDAGTYHEFVTFQHEFVRVKYIGWYRRRGSADLAPTQVRVFCCPNTY